MRTRFWSVSRDGGLALAVTMTLSPAAFADTIDGEWCREGRSFNVDGPHILTYGGSAIRSDDNRHGFRYVAPANEPEAGIENTVVLRGEELLDLFRKPDDGAKSAAESWRRCRVTS